MQVLIDNETLKPLVKQVLKEALTEMEQDRARLPERLSFSEAEAAALLGLNRHQLRDERLRKRIACSSGPGKRILYKREDLVSYLQRTRTEASAEA